MLEIIAIFSLGKSIKVTVEEKGLKPLKYILLLIAMWIGFEILGGILGALLFGNGLGIYIFALLGAAFGGYLSYNIAKNANPSEYTLD